MSFERAKEIEEKYRIVPIEEEISLKSHDEDTKLSKIHMLKHFARIAIPSVITNVFSHFVMMVNTVYAGQFENDSA
jgi:Na+-driven multidrug efflux pump